MFRARCRLLMMQRSTGFLGAAATDAQRVAVPSLHVALGLAQAEETARTGAGVATGDALLPCAQGDVAAMAGVSMVRNYKYELVARQAARDNFIFAKQEGPATYSYFSMLDTAPIDVARRMLKVPRSERNFHVVFGREGAPLDFFADIDAQCAEHDRTRGERLLLQVLDAFGEEAATLGSEIDHVVALDGHSPDKLSYHLHIRLKGVAFADYRHVRDVVSTINRKLNHNVIDPAPLRRNGMLRTAYSPKFGDPFRCELSPLVAQDPELARRTRVSREMPHDEIMLASFVNRTEAGLKTVRRVGATREVLRDERGAIISSFVHERNKSMRFHDCIRAMDGYRVEWADDYKTWIAVGLALHSFGSDDTTFMRWVNFARLSPGKFDLSRSRKLWTTFAKRRDCYNWRRGFNYLTKTIFTDSGMVAPKIDRRRRK